MQRETEPDEVTLEQWIGAVSALVIILVPIVLVLLFPANPVVHVAFGDGRIVLFWLVVGALVMLYRESIDRIIAKIVSTLKSQ